MKLTPDDIPRLNYYLKIAEEHTQPKDPWFDNFLKRLKNETLISEEGMD